MGDVRVERLRRFKGEEICCQAPHILKEREVVGAGGEEGVPEAEADGRRLAMGVGETWTGEKVMNRAIILGEKIVKTQTRKSEQKKDRRCFLHARAIRRTLSHGPRTASTPGCPGTDTYYTHVRTDGFPEDAFQEFLTTD